MATTRAIRRYRPEPIPDDDLGTILWHATRAPSGSNRQPFRFLVLRDGPRAVAARRVLGESFRALWAAKREAEDAKRREAEEKEAARRREIEEREAAKRAEEEARIQAKLDEEQRKREEVAAREAEKALARQREEEERRRQAEEKRQAEEERRRQRAEEKAKRGLLGRRQKQERHDEFDMDADDESPIEPIPLKFLRTVCGLKGSHPL